MNFSLFFNIIDKVLVSYSLMTSTFARCHHSLAAETSGKYECDSMDQNIQYIDKVIHVKKLINGA